MIYSFKPLLFLGSFLLPLGLYATPPDIIGTREVLLGANDSVMALYVQTWENEGSHYFRRETLAFSIRSIESGAEKELLVLSVVEYLPDEDFEMKVRKVVKASEFDLVTELNRYGMTLPFTSVWPVDFIVKNEEIWLNDPDKGEVRVVDSLGLSGRFSQPDEYGVEEGDPGLYVLGSVYSTGMNDWVFLEISLNDYYAVDPVTRIVPIRTAEIIERLGAAPKR